MALYVQVIENQVKQCWDSLPPDGVGNNGWKNAIEVRPAIKDHRQGYTAHTFNLATDPVQIVYGTYEIEIADRKNQMKANASYGFQQEMQKQMNDPSTYDPAKLQAAKDAVAPKIAAIEAATSHDDLDALM
jgi:hypothetical protein